MLDVRQGPLGRDGIFVGENEDLRFGVSGLVREIFVREPYVFVLAEHAVDVFESAVGGLGEEEVDNGDEGGVEDGPDDVEFPVERLDSWGKGWLVDRSAGSILDFIPIGVISTT